MKTRLNLLHFKREEKEIPKLNVNIANKVK